MRGVRVTGTVVGKRAPAVVSRDALFLIPPRFFWLWVDARARGLILARCRLK